MLNHFTFRVLAWQTNGLGGDNMTCASELSAIRFFSPKAPDFCPQKLSAVIGKMHSEKWTVKLSDDSRISRTQDLFSKDRLQVLGSWI